MTRTTNRQTARAQPRSQSEHPLEVRLVTADEDDPEVLARVIRALADVLSGRVG